MLTFLSQNIGTILVIAVLAVIVFFVIRTMIRDKQQGKSSCGNNCAHCAAAGSCHNAAKPRRMPKTLS